MKGDYNNENLKKEIIKARKASERGCEITPRKKKDQHRTNFGAGPLFVVNLS